MDKDDIIKELEARIAELEKKKVQTITEKDLYPGMALEDKDGYHFIVTTEHPRKILKHLAMLPELVEVATDYAEAAIETEYESDKEYERYN